MTEKAGSHDSAFFIDNMMERQILEIMEYLKEFGLSPAGISPCFSTPLRVS